MKTPCGTIKHVKGMIRCETKIESDVSTIFVVHPVGIDEEGFTDLLCESFIRLSHIPDGLRQQVLSNIADYPPKTDPLHMTILEAGEKATEK